MLNEIQQDEIRRGVGLPPCAVRAGPTERSEATRPEKRCGLRWVGHHRQIQPEAASDPKRRSEEVVLSMLVS